jgi:hypothetical protein
MIHDDYACPRGRVAMSGDDGMDSTTRVPICQGRVGLCGYVLSCQALNDAALQGLSCNGAYLVLESPRA